MRPTTYGVTPKKVIPFRMSRYNYFVVVPILVYGECNENKRVKIKTSRTKTNLRIW